MVGKILPLHDSEVGDLSRGDPSGSSSNRPQISVARYEGEHAVISFKDQPSGFVVLRHFIVCVFVSIRLG